MTPSFLASFTLIHIAFELSPLLYTPFGLSLTCNSQSMALYKPCNMWLDECTKV